MSTIDPTPIPPPHLPADDTEQVYFEGSPLLRAEVAKVLAHVAVAVVLVAIIFLWRHFQGIFPPTIVTLILLAVAAGVAVWPVVMVRTVRYRITNYRIDVSRGAVSTDTDTMELWHVEDLRLHQSLPNRLFGVGTITVFSHDDTTPTLQLRGLPEPQRIFTLLEQRVIAVKRQRGVMKMDSGQ